MDVNEFVQTDRTIAEMVEAAADPGHEVGFIRESIEVAERLAEQASSLDDLAELSLRCAASYVLLAAAGDLDEAAAARGATWVGRAVTAVAGRSAAEFGCLPRAIALMSSLLPHLDESTHHQALLRLHGWLVRLGAALEAVEATRQQAEVAWRVALASMGVQGVDAMTALARRAAVDAFTAAGDQELAGRIAAGDPEPG